MKTLIGLLAAAASLTAAEYKAGMARKAITPAEPIRMSGYAARIKPSQGVVHDIWAKALAIEDQKGSRVVLVTLDLLNVPRTLADDVAAGVRTRHGLPRERLVLSASHTHAGPMIGTQLFAIPDDPGEARVVREYTRKVTDDIIEIVGAALRDMSPADLALGRSTAGFAINRREKTATGFKIGVNRDGPEDHEVPVILVRQGTRVRAVLFGYACHNTSTQHDFFQIGGDYAGFAQKEIEARYPGANAMFWSLCAGDQNPEPRGTIELAERHGKELAESVSKGAADAQPVRGALRVAFETTPLMFAAHTRETYEKRLEEKDPWRVRHARYMLGFYDRGQPIRSVEYPVQAVRFGKNLTLLFLGGEVVVDYALRAKKEFADEPLVVAAYSNHVMGYIPSLRVLREGGYEADSSMIYYGLPGPFDETVEERVFAAIRKAMARVK